MTFGEKVILFYKTLEFGGTLPERIAIMNPYRDNPQIIPVISQFYSKFYSDNNLRHLILGINPGRFGAGVTGIPFTDTKRLNEKCGLSIPGMKTFEPSSVFIYEMIDAFGGVSRFYSKFYISSVSPLGFTAMKDNGRTVNYNYYDNKSLTDSVRGFMIKTIERQLEFGIRRDVCFCLGTGKNFRFILELNKKHHYFDSVVAFEHPRYVMQYKSKQKQEYIAKYLGEFSKCSLEVLPGL